MTSRDAAWHNDCTVKTSKFRRKQNVYKKHEIKADEEERFRNVTPGDNQGIPEVKPGPKRSYHTYRQTAKAMHGLIFETSI